ncbi:D-alanyl-D-alanine carboxypeptidase [Bombiscardovia apis]|uniref:D-alanyl-D-alanine carboxypeptidase n=1 Tax=Bombiscardovia apis TaxID=2932182 RepID=A0ABM8BDQ9_9BIFI|nr:D-alanyl-D-alanine carboxypeptidase [Bombiscardovia apis]BDR55038.1 D-alanyl-D-alanine carboxypeptidase [Bombiscardovia apis]
MGTHARRIQHPLWQIVLSVLAVLAVFVGYIFADAYDIIPGPLTVHQKQYWSDSQPVRKVVPPAAVEGKLEGGEPIDVAAAQELIDSLVSSPGVGSDVSVVVMGAKGSVAAEREQDTLRQPASTLKTLTAAAAALSIDMGSSLQTSTYLIQSEDPTPQLVLKGHGDMLLGAGFNDLNHVNGRAGLSSLAQHSAQELKKRSVTKVRLAYDSSFFGEARSPQGIEQSNPDGIYFTPTSTMAVDEGRVRSNQDRDANPDGKGVYVPHDESPEAESARTFMDCLQGQGITVEGELSQETIPTDLQPVASVESAALSEIMAYMLRNSDNTIAELFGRLTAVHEGTENSPKGAVEAITRVLTREGVTLDGAHLADCSGLTPGSAVSAAMLTAVQRLACDGKHGQLAPLVEGLSVVGLIGTAAERGEGSEPNGLVRVKTGTLDQVTSMSGNVSRLKGGILEFAVIVNNPSDMGAAAQAVNTFVSALPRL